MTQLDTASKRRWRRRRSQKIKQILENAMVLAAIALVVGVLVFVFNPQTADGSGSPVTAGTLLKP